MIGFLLYILPLIDKKLSKTNKNCLTKHNTKSHKYEHHKSKHEFDNVLLKLSLSLENANHFAYQIDIT